MLTNWHSICKIVVANSCYKSTKCITAYRCIDCSESTRRVLLVQQCDTPAHTRERVAIIHAAVSLVIAPIVTALVLLYNCYDGEITPALHNVYRGG